MTSLLLEYICHSLRFEQCSEFHLESTSWLSCQMAYFWASKKELTRVILMSTPEIPRNNYWLINQMTLSSVKEISSSGVSPSLFNTWSKFQLLSRTKPMTLESVAILMSNPKIPRNNSSLLNQMTLSSVFKRDFIFWSIPFTL